MVFQYETSGDDIVIQKKKEEFANSIDPVELLLSKKEEQNSIREKKLAFAGDEQNLSFEPLDELKDKNLKKFDDDDGDNIRLKKKLADQDGVGESKDGDIILQKKLSDQDSFGDLKDGDIRLKKKLADQEFNPVRPVSVLERIEGTAAWIISPVLGASIALDHAYRDAMVARENEMQRRMNEKLTSDDVYN